ncbi:MAG: DUF945 family protein [Plesiomonas sp.]|uniref:DUF945 family protein n=1 Tax=Plesiomonas sp. TaxID=2486279 RepID=UPI003F2F1C6A
MANVKGTVIGLSLAAIAVAGGLQYYTAYTFDQQLAQVKTQLQDNKSVTITETSRTLFSRNINVKWVVEPQAAGADQNAAVGPVEIVADNAVTLWPLHIQADTRLLSEGVVAEIEKLSGKPLPFSMHSSYTLGSNVNSEFSLGLVEAKDAGNHITLQPASGTVTFNPQQETLAWSSQWQGGELVSTEGTTFTVGAIDAQASQQQIDGLWFGTNNIAIKSINSQTPQGQMSVSDMKVITDQKNSGNNLDFSLDVTLGEYALQKPTHFSVSDVVLNTTVTGLNKQALQRAASKTEMTEQQAQAVLLELLGKGVTLSINKLSAKIGEGALEGKGVMQLPADRATPTDWDALLLPLTADAQLSVDEKVFMKQPQMLLMLLQFSSQGWVTQAEGKLNTAVTIHDGMLSVNGNEVTQLF